LLASNLQFQREVRDVQGQGAKKTMIDLILQWVAAFCVGVCVGSACEWISENYEVKKKAKP
jgi:hypothetical protein